MRFLFTCGGTAGHINPALAVASILKDTLSSCEVLFIGAEGNMEMQLIPMEGYEIKSVKITSVSREKNLHGLAHNMETVKNVLKSKADAKQIIRDFKPDAVIGTGGYVCYPVISAAADLGIPTFIHESNAGPGLTTKLLSPKVDRIMVGFEGCSHQYKDPSKVVVTGTPVRSAFSLYTKESARTELGIPADEKLVVSVWGSLGAGFMNQTLSEMIPLLAEQKSFRLVHATGTRYYDSFRKTLEENCPDYEEAGIEVREYIHDMARVMKAADLIICRAGASTLSELTYMGKPAILVPSPNVTDNHQEKNARVLEKCGGSLVMLEKDMTPQALLQNINDLLSNQGRLEEMSQKMLTLSYNDSAEKICSLILECINNKR